MLVPVLITAALVLMALAFWLGMRVGRADVVNRLIDAKDPEAWQFAHYLRADFKNDATNKRP